MMTLGSLFDGSGGFPLAGKMHGIRPVWASEIEPFPLRVTAARLPEMKQLGDITKIDGSKVEPVDIVTFGSPCQDLSIAGKQKGIHEGERSNLFFEAVRIIREMRHATADKFPRFAVWENVPGAFSSNGGEDFRAVLEALGGIACQDGLSIPRPKKWSHAGCVVGTGWSVAWRVYDAQYWGVPQRRKRIYLIADLGSERAGEILFERESLPGDPEPGRAPGQGPADDAEGSAGGSHIAFKERAGKPGGARASSADMTGPSHSPPSVSQSPTTAQSGGNVIAEQSVYGVDCRNAVLTKEKTHTVQAKPGGGISLNCTPSVIYPIQNYAQDSRCEVKDPAEPCQTLNARMGTGGGNVPMILINGGSEHE